MFGTILPFIGWRVQCIGSDGLPCDPPSNWEGNVFMVEWLGCGVALYVGKTWIKDTPND